jgi:3,4-dihydroxy-9,10-secoandrosta-1,3,5(10)-triene-9,17-dione 4,5-dioxygenase
MGNVQALGYLGLGVRNLDDWERFAAEILGAQTTRVTLDGRPVLYLRIDDLNYRIVVHEGEDELSFVGWQVAGPEELHALVANLDAAGVAWKDDIELAAARGVQRLVTCSDPAGVTLEFHYGAVVPQSAFVSQTGARFVTVDDHGRDLGLGHVVIVCPNFNESIRFYLDVLDFRISDHIVPVPGLLLTFLHCNPRHHSIAIAPSPNGQTEINHFMLEVADLRTVGRALDMVNAQGTQQASLGQHTNDKMVSFYVKTPSGFGIEYGTSGVLVDDEHWRVVTYDASSYWGHEFHRD